MTKELQTLWARLAKLATLPEAIQAKQAALILRILDEQSGDGSIFEPEIEEKPAEEEKSFMHLAGSVKGLPPDLSSNKKYLEGLGASSMGRKN